MLEEYLKMYPLGKAQEAKLRYLLSQVEDPENILGMAIEKGIVPEVLFSLIENQMEPIPEEGDEEIRNQEPDKKGKKPKFGFKSPKFSMPSFNWNWTGQIFPVLKSIGLVLLILVVVLGIYYLVFSVKPGYIDSAQSPLPVIPTELKAIDLAHSAWWSMTQYVIMILALLTIIGIPADAFNRGQISDAFWVLIAVTLIMTPTFWTNVLVGFLGPQTSMGFTPKQLEWVVALVSTFVAFAMVIVASQQGGLDMTPLAGFVTMLGASGLLFGHLGAIQIVFSIPDGSVLPFNQVGPLLTLKQFALAQMSLSTYILLGGGSALYAAEIIRTMTRLEQKGLSRRLLFVGASTAGLLFYLILKRQMLAWGVPPFAIVSIAILLAGAAAAADREFGKSNINVADGEIRLRSSLIPPYDKVAVQFALSLFLIAVYGTF